MCLLFDHDYQKCEINSEFLAKPLEITYKLNKSLKSTFSGFEHTVRNVFIQRYMRKKADLDSVLYTLHKLK